MDAATEAAVRGGDDPLPANQAGEAADALGNQLRVLDPSRAGKPSSPVLSPASRARFASAHRRRPWDCSMLAFRRRIA
jgi:hypothetical protein